MGEVLNKGIVYLLNVSDKSVSIFKNSIELTNSKISKRIIKGMTENNPNNQTDIIQIKDFMLVQRVVRKINSILDTKELLKMNMKTHHSVCSHYRSFDKFKTIQRQGQH